MKNKKWLLLCLFIFSSKTVFSGEMIVKVAGISGIAYIEKDDISKSMRAFRGSEIKENYKIRTSSNSQVMLTILQNGIKTSDVILNQNTTLLINESLFSEDGKTKTSLSLIEGHIKVDAVKGSSNSTEIHTANTSTIVKGTQFEVAFAEDGSTIVALSDGSLEVVTNEATTVLKPKEAQITDLNSKSKIVYQSAINNPIVFLNKSEESSRENLETTIENLMNAMQDITNAQSILSKEREMADKDNDEAAINAIEMKQHRLLAANEGYYKAITKLIELDPNKKESMFQYAKTSASLYGANQRSIDRMNSALQRSRSRFERARKTFEAKQENALK